MRLEMQLLLMRTAMWKCCKIFSPHNSPVFLWVKTRYSSKMEQQATQQECQWTQLMLCSRTESFPGIGISHAPSPDLTACDYFLWGCLTIKVLETRSTTIADLKQRIQDEAAAVPVEMLRQVMNSFRYQIEDCVRRNGSHPGAILSKHKF